MIITQDYDECIIREVRGYQRLLDAFDLKLRGANVLDLGAHKGFFSALALEQGAAKVVAIEPSSENCKVFRKNAKSAHLLHGACIGWKQDVIELTRASRMKSDAAFSVVRKSGQRQFVENVKAYTFRDIVIEHDIHLVKMDFQGAEWGVFLRDIPKCVRAFFGEIHYGGPFLTGPDMKIKPLSNKKATDDALGSLIDQGFELFFWRNGQWRIRPPYKTKARFQDVVFVRS